jgi:hypothetical protein
VTDYESADGVRWSGWPKAGVLQGPGIRWILIVHPRTLPEAKAMLERCRETWPDLEIVADPFCPERSWRRRTFWEWLTRKQILHPRIGYLVQTEHPENGQVFKLESI